ncbi:MAG TPA: hypothetical protein VGQ35_00915 [Dongiaceae bacterium]|nr:hypothetical protein [Dongiaceae bacterium]
MAVALFLIAFWVSEAAHRSPDRLPEFAMPCAAGWWPLGNVAIKIGDGTTRAACLSVPKDAVFAQQGARWAELELAHFDGDAECVSRLPSSRVRVEQWQSAKAPRPSSEHPARGSDYPDYLRFDAGADTSGTEMFVPRNSSSGLRTIACVVGADKCWGTARAALLLVRWPTARQRLMSGLEQDWACIRQALEAVKVD